MKRQKPKASAEVKLSPLAAEKLRSSGLNEEDAQMLKIVSLDASEVPRLHPSFKELASIKINYHGPDGAPISDWPCSKPFYRLRYLETPTDFSGISSKKPIRYVQEPNTAPVAYFPRNQNWADIVDNTDEPLIITEGELKAAKACKEGFPTIGLGGVYNWRSYKLGITWLPSLDLVKWVKRNVYICFDSDYQSNPMVCAALKAFADELHCRGAFCHLVTLPQLAGYDKVGLDDFLTFGGPTANDLFKEILSQAEPMGLTAPLWWLNNKYVYIQDPGLIIDQESLATISPSAFKDHSQSNLRYQERSLNPDGTMSFKTVPASPAWLRWPLRNEVAKLTYRPGEQKFITHPRPLFNSWTGWGVEPNPEAGVDLFLDLVNHLFSKSEPEAKDWFLKWCAWPLQHPGTKMFSSVVIHGIKHGTGKSLVGYTLARIYGKNFTEISQMDLHGSFNEWAEAKQFVMGDDITGSNKRQDNDFLKKLITQRELRVNKKYVPSYEIPDCINYFFTANHPDSFFLEDDDRRFFIHEVQVPPMPEEFYVEYDLWLDTGGSAAVFDYLLHLDLSGFNPAAPAFKTHAKERMIANVQSDLAGWVRNLVAAPDHTLKVGEVVETSELMTSKQLLQFYDPTGRTGTTANGLGRELARAGVRQVCNGNPLRLLDGSQSRYYVVRNDEKWANAAPAKAIEYLNKQLTAFTKHASKY